MPTQRDASENHHRIDIQGLRAIAVLLVVADHLAEWPSGGFVGVDVFFVISGFLITGLLIREGERRGRVSILNFYRNRIRRILPASLVVIAATTVGAYGIMLRDQFDAVAGDAKASALFWMNWHLVDTGTDYFSASRPPSPLQHYWSLAVEEQFYLVWPVVLVLLLAVSRRMSRCLHVRATIAVFAAAVVATSFAWALQQSADDPLVSYFSTLTRAWELGIGALLAAAAPWLTRQTSAMRHIGALTGMACLVLSALMIDGSDPFPAPIGALPVVATALVIAAGIGTERPVAAVRLIANALGEWIGDRSYSLYLWHWPILILLKAAGMEGVRFYLTAVLLIVATTTASYRFVERPVLDSDFLRPTKRYSGPRTSDLLVGAMGIVCALLVTLSLIPKEVPTDGVSIAASALELDGASNDDPDQSPLQQLQDSLSDALEAKEYPPTVKAALGTASGDIAPEMDAGTGCFNPTSLDDTRQCTYGKPEARHLAVVVGDSVAASWLPGIRAALEPVGYRVHAITQSDCPFADVDITLDFAPSAGEHCNDSRASIYSHVASLHPDLVIGSSTEDIYSHMTSGASGQGAINEWSAGTAKAVRTFARSAGRVVVLGANPTGPAIGDCATRFSRPGDCVTEVERRYLDKTQAEAGGAKLAGGEFVDTHDWFCYLDRCPIFAMDTVMRWDPQHITASYAKLLGPLLRVELLGGRTQAAVG